MPSVLGKRKRGSAITDFPNGRHGKAKQDARQAIVRTVEGQIELERSMKLKEMTATEARIAWAGAVVDRIQRAADGSVAALDFQRAKDAALMSYWSIGSAYYSWPRPHLASYGQGGSDDPNSTLSAIPPPPSVDFPPLSAEVRASVKNIISKGNKPLLVKYVLDPRSDPVILVLACPSCQRADLSTVQGFYNHCRLAHQLTYAGHSECIEASGQLVSKEDIQSVGLDDIEIKGTGIPSIQRLFQRAVRLQPPPSIPASQTLGIPLRSSQSRSPSPVDVESHLNKTLGLHGDTPALAQFLGTTARRKEIKVFDTQDEIDILDGAVADIPRLRPFLRPRTGIATTQQAIDDAVPDSEPFEPNMDTTEEIATSMAFTPILPAPTLQGRQSRFYISRRVTITDRSRYISSSHRNADMGSDTHYWSLTVTAPSYMPSLSTFLQEVTITTTGPETQTFTISDPPYIASGRASSPFLAHVRLSWAGPQNKDTTTTHWVELDLTKIGSWLVGDEQMLDVQLDKETTFLREREDAPLRKHFDIAAQQKPASEQSESTKSILEEVLLRLLPKFPLTLGDVKTKTPPEVPYTLVPSRRRFLALTIGRQRAIEWRRARCLRLAAQEELLQIPSALELRASTTTAGVLDWLWARSGKQRILDDTRRPTVKRRTILNGKHSDIDLYCSYCGTRASLNTAREASCPHGCSNSLSSIGLSNTLSMRQPDPRILAPEYQQYSQYMRQAQLPHTFRASFAYTARDILSSADPELVLSIRHIMPSVGLPHFGSPESTSLYPLNQLGRSQRDVDETLGPVALLSHIARIFIRRLTCRSVRLSRSTLMARNSIPSMDEAQGSIKEDGSTAGAANGSRPNGLHKKTTQHTALVPAHVLHALTAPAWDAPFAVGFDILTRHGLGKLEPRAQRQTKTEDKG